MMRTDDVLAGCDRSVSGELAVPVSGDEDAPWIRAGRCICRRGLRVGGTRCNRPCRVGSNYCAGCAHNRCMCSCGGCDPSQSGSTDDYDYVGQPAILEDQMVSSAGRDMGSMPLLEPFVKQSRAMSVCMTSAAALCHSEATSLATLLPFRGNRLGGYPLP